MKRLRILINVQIPGLELETDNTRIICLFPPPLPPSLLPLFLQQFSPMPRIALGSRNGSYPVFAPGRILLKMN